MVTEVAMPAATTRHDAPAARARVLYDLAHRAAILALFALVAALGAVYARGVDAPLPPVALAAATGSVILALAHSRRFTGVLVFSLVMAGLSAGLIVALQTGLAQALVERLRN